MAVDKTRVYITVDVETSLGGAWRNPDYAPLPLERTVFGKVGAEFYGIPLIMDILEKYGLRATFFTEVFCAHNVGRDEVAKALRSMRDRGHDVQLHLHPVQRFYSEYIAGQPRREKDLMYQFTPDEQRQLIRDGVSLFRELSGQKPRAYRAGCYGASEETLQALRENDIDIDSSYNLAYLGDTCGFKIQPLNAPIEIEGVCEFPVTVFRVAGVPGYKPLEISAVSVNEILAAIRLLQGEDCKDVVLVLHSFSLLKNLGIRYDACRPDGMVIQRLRKLCAVFAELKDEIEVTVLGEANLTTISKDHSHVVPTLGWLQPSFRRVCQAANRLPWL